MPELRPGMLSGLIREVSAAGEEHLRAALAELAQVIERQAKLNASNGSHRRDTPTPARPGTGPAVVSGTLRRAIVHSRPQPNGVAGWEARVGMAAGVYPPRTGHARSVTAASRYAYYLETGLRNGTTYPFLSTAYRFGVQVAAPVIWRKHFMAWPRI